MGRYWGVIRSNMASPISPAVITPSRSAKDCETLSAIDDVFMDLGLASTPKRGSTSDVFSSAGEWDPREPGPAMLLTLVKKRAVLYRRLLSELLPRAAAAVRERRRAA
jgi:hypothetical protein